jgi:DNA polymerase III sliding clamp (beta) subunit (PCNA family)
MITIATMPASTYRAAFACKATKDVRYYLNGLYLDADRAKIVGTDGHMLYINDVDVGDEPGPSIIFEPVKILVSAETVKVERHDDTCVMLHVTARNGSTTMHICKILDGRYPDYQAVTPPGDPAPTDVMGFNVEQLARLKQVFKRYAQFEFFGPHNVYRATGREGEGTVVLMPCKL